LSAISDFDILFCLSSTSFESEFSQITKSKTVLIEASLDQNSAIREKINSLRNSGVTIIFIPVKNLAGKTAGETTFYSAVILGILSNLFNMSPAIINQITFDRFKSKGCKITLGNEAAFKAGFSWSEQHCSPLFASATSDGNEFLPQRIFIEGNQAISHGAIAAGCTFFASYPITPATTIGNYLSTHMNDTGGFAYQAEDEIAALGAVIGASFSGSKAMTATSGPGLSLMQEFIGFASISELPVVIADIQRAGPSTGMPTNHGQDDLLAAAFGSHGDYQKIIVAPTNVSDCLYTTIHAFNLAERYQCAVIILSDSALASMKETIENPDFSSVKIEN
jgi:2-oxoglutarate ferredoxin oxidoreductase subunit alpha